MRYYITYTVPKSDIKKERKIRDKLLGSAHWCEENEDEDGAIIVTVSVDEKTASFIALRYQCTSRPNYGI